MIKICFLQAEEVIDGIKLLTDDLRMEITGKATRILLSTFIMLRRI